MQPAPAIEAKDRVYMPIITALSIAIPLVVAILMYMPRNPDTLGTQTYSFQPFFHAILNGATALFLLVGLYFIKSKQIALHRISMLVAFTLSSVFLLSYVIYHFNVPTTKFGGEGAIRGIYLFILLTHILLATSIVPLALITFYRSFTGQFEKHKKIARITFPIWLYVALTGVVVYILMVPYYPSALQ